MASALNPENKKFPEEFIIDLRSMMTKDAVTGWQASDTKWIVSELYEEFRSSLRGIRHRSSRESSPLYETLYVCIDDYTPPESRSKVTEAQVIEAARGLVSDRQRHLSRKRNAL